MLDVEATQPEGGDGGTTPGVGAGLLRGLATTARARQRNVLDRFAIDFSLCMYCGICIEACPFDALFWSPQFEYSELDIRDMLHEKDRLAGWARGVPPPPALDPGAPDPKEAGTARRSPRGRPG